MSDLVDKGVVVPNWKAILTKSMTVWVAVLGAILPEVPDLILKWIASDSSAELLSPATKNVIRGLIMFFVIPAVRIWKQKSLSEPTKGVLHE